MASILKNPIYVIGGIAVLGAVIWALQPDAAPTKIKTAPRKAAVTSKANELIQPEDYKVHFAPVNVTTRDMFKPLITKKAAGTIAGPTTSTGVIPANILGDGKTWAYTGMATVDGAEVALVECQTDGQLAFVKPGEEWNSCKIEKIDPDELVLAGIDGVPVTVKVKDVTAPSTPGTVNRPLGGGTLNGPIRNQMATSPDDGSVVDNSGDTTNTNNNGGGRGRGGRGRGGRRGGRGGGTGGGGFGGGN